MFLHAVSEGFNLVEICGSQVGISETQQPVQEHQYIAQSENAVLFFGQLLPRRFECFGQCACLPKRQNDEIRHSEVAFILVKTVN